MVPLASLNQHFDIPQAVSSIFTGRETALKDLEHSLLAPVLPHQPQMQKRFVVYGLGGSGKTQFCCKFAQDNQKRYDRTS
jgi:signal recognition particle GTPase